MSHFLSIFLRKACALAPKCKSLAMWLVEYLCLCRMLLTLLGSQMVRQARQVEVLA